MQFTGLDRIALLYNDIFPTVGNVMLYGLVIKAQAALRLTHDELLEIEYQQIDAKRFFYQPQKARAIVIDVEMPLLLATELWKKLDALNQETVLDFAMIPLYWKFRKLVTGEDPPPEFAHLMDGIVLS